MSSLTPAKTGVAFGAIRSSLVNPYNIQGLAETIIQLLENPLLRKQMGEAGLRCSKTCFTFDQFKVRFASVMEPLLKL